LCISIKFSSLIVQNLLISSCTFTHVVGTCGKFCCFIAGATKHVVTSAPQIKDLLEDVCSQIATKCFLVGKLLELDEAVLARIKDQYQGRDLEASYEIVMHWLFHSPEPTWKSLIGVLTSDAVGEYTLAEYLSEKFLSLSISS